MSTENTTEVEMVSVPKAVLQDLIWNVQLGGHQIAVSNQCDEAMERQCDELQIHVNGEDYVDPYEGFTLDGDTNEGENVHYLFGKRV